MSASVYRKKEDEEEKSCVCDIRIRIKREREREREKERERERNQSRYRREKHFELPWNCPIMKLTFTIEVYSCVVPAYCKSNSAI